MGRAFRISQPNRFPDPRRLKVEECFGRFRNPAAIFMITSLYLKRLKEPEQLSLGQICN